MSKPRPSVTGIHQIVGYEVYWRYKEEVRISRDGVLYDLWYHECRHGGDGYVKVTDLHTKSLENIGVKLRKAADSDCDLYILREATS